MLYKEIDGLKIAYTDEGQGDVVFVFHGWAANKETMKAVQNSLIGKFRVIMPDLPGFGGSDKPSFVWGAYEYAESMEKFINSFKLDEFSLVGHSHGGRTSIILASRMKSQVKKMVLIDSAGLISKKSIKYYAKVYWFKCCKVIYKTLFFWQDTEAKMERFYKKHGSQDYRDADGIMRQIMVKVINEDLKPLLKEIQTQTLLVWGENDTATPLYMGEIMEKEIKGSGLVVIKNAGHFSYVDDYPQFNAVMRSFFGIQ